MRYLDTEIQKRLERLSRVLLINVKTREAKISLGSCSECHTYKINLGVLNIKFLKKKKKKKVATIDKWSMEKSILTAFQRFLCMLVCEYFYTIH